MCVWCECVTALSLKVYVKRQSGPDCFPQVFRLGNSVTVLSACVVGSASVVIMCKQHWSVDYMHVLNFTNYFRWFPSKKTANYSDSSERPVPK